MRESEADKGLKESINGENEQGGSTSKKKIEPEGNTITSLGKENQAAKPPRRISVGEPMGLPMEHQLPSAPKPVVDDSAQKNGLKRQNSGRQRCRCWCSCCCSCLNLKNGEPKGKEAESENVCDPDPPPTLDEVRSWGESFDKLMRSTNGRKVFQNFLKCEYSEENILFWLACEELKKERIPEVIEEKARLIYEDYISILSPKEVSLDSRVRDVVNENMRNPKPSTFDEAQLQIYTLMHRDSYPRFINSPLYKKMAQLNSTPTGTPSGNPPGPGSSQRGSTVSSTASRKQSATS